MMRHGWRVACVGMWVWACGSAVAGEPVKSLGLDAETGIVVLTKSGQVHLLREQKEPQKLGDGVLDMCVHPARSGAVALLTQEPNRGEVQGAYKLVVVEGGRASREYRLPHGQWLLPFWGGGDQVGAVLLPEPAAEDALRLPMIPAILPADPNQKMATWWPAAAEALGVITQRPVWGPKSETAVLCGIAAGGTRPVTDPNSLPVGEQGFCGVRERDVRWLQDVDGLARARLFGPFEEAYAVACYRKAVAANQMLADNPYVAVVFDLKRLVPVGEPLVLGKVASAEAAYYSPKAGLSVLTWDGRGELTLQRAGAKPVVLSNRYKRPGESWSAHAALSAKQAVWAEGDQIVVRDLTTEKETRLAVP